LAYDRQKVANVDDLSRVGANIAIKDIQRQPDKFCYSVPQSGPDFGRRREAADRACAAYEGIGGAGDAATGQVDPTKTSGEAIKAARDQAAVPLNEQIAAYKQFVEDVAMLWYKMWVAYSPQGLKVSYANEDGEQVTAIISADILRSMDIDIRIDVSPVDRTPSCRRRLPCRISWAAGISISPNMSMRSATIRVCPRVSFNRFSTPGNRLSRRRFWRLCSKTHAGAGSSGLIMQMGGGAGEMPQVPGGNAY
jgi:hypothetical protein